MDARITTAQQRAKHPGSAIAGPYGHPVHATLVPVPIGAWVAVLVLDIASRASDKYAVAYAKAATVVLGIGLVGAVLAAIFGLMDFGQLTRRTRAIRTATTHLVLNLLVIVAFGASFLARLGAKDGPVPTGLVVLTALGLAVLVVSGWLGGRLAYRYGVRVADEATQAEGFAEVGGLLPEDVSGAGRVNRRPGTNVPVDRR